MRSTSNTFSIEAATDAIIDYRGKTPPKAQSGIRLVTAKVVKGGQIREDKAEFIAQETYDWWMRRGIPQRSDVLITTEAPLGEVAILRSDEKIALAQRIILLRANTSIVTPKYLFYALQSDLVQADMKARASGTTVLGIKQSELRKVLLEVPPLPQQRRIAGILSAYDELILNCQRRIEILEEMARSTYREWFEHFRFPGYQDTQMVASPQGDIPDGWMVRSVGDLLSFHIGGGWGKEEPDDNHTKPGWVIRGTDIPDARSALVTGVPFRYHKPSNIKSRRLQPGDIIFEVSGGSKGQPVGRSMFVTPELVAAIGGDFLCASFCKKMQVKTDLYRAEIMYLSFMEAYDSGEIEQYQVQSTGISNFQWKAYLKQEYRVVPPQDIQGHFLALIRPVLSKIGVLGRSIQNLRDTRNLLLPRLMSGQLNLEAAPEG